MSKEFKNESSRGFARGARRASTREGPAHAHALSRASQNVQAAPDFVGVMIEG
jgi:hypothetical protein